MKKIYSFVLMAAMLLIGTNVKADEVNVTSAEGLVGAFTNIPATRTIVLGADVELVSTDTENPLIIDGGQVVTLDLNNHNLTGYTDPVIRVWHGKLTITGTGTFTSRVDAVVLKGSTESTASEYSVLEVGPDVKIVGTHSDYILWITNNNGCAYGAKMIINGEARSAKAGLYINGNVQQKEGNVPEIYVNADAKVIAADSEVGIYAAGYGKWYIQGYVSGGAGIYAKSGDFEVSGNGKVEATATEYTEAQPNGNGYTGGLGCAIIQDSKNGYAGGMTLTVTGNATIESDAENGYAIQEIKTDASQSQTESINLQGGTFNGNLETTAEVKDNIILNGTITGGTYSGDISAFLDPAATDLVPTEDPVTHQTVYVVKVAVDVTVNAAGLSTFSSAKAVKLPEGLVAYEALSLSENTLQLHKVAEEGQVIPANKGVILYGNSGKLEESTDAAETISDDNLLRPATAFDAAVAASQKIYVLHGSELWVFDGDQFPANKAFLLLSNTAGAPARIRLVFDAVEGVENVEFEAVKAEKFIENGQVLIKRGEKVYNVQGQIVK